jgi:hypothetical protein
MTEARPTTPLSPAAVRMRRSRELRRKGLRIVQFAVRDAEVDALVSHGLLNPVDRQDRAAIARALGRLLVRRIRRHRPHTRITIRGDCHYGRHEVMMWCEANGLHYIFGLSSNVVRKLASERRKSWQAEY